MAEADIDSLALDDLIPAAKQWAAGDNNRQWSASDAQVICWYKAYLHCRYQHDGDNKSEKFVAISQQADDLWHAHILQTSRYTDDTNRIFGHYLHHTKKDRVNQDTPQFRADSAEYKQLCQDLCAAIPPPPGGNVGRARTARTAATAAGGGPLPPGVPPDVVHLCS